MILSSLPYSLGSLIAFMPQNARDKASGGGGGMDLDFMSWVILGFAALVFGGVLTAFIQHWHAGRKFRKQREMANQINLAGPRRPRHVSAGERRR